VSRLLVLSLALVLAACAARSKSGKRASSSDDSEFKEWGAESSESSKDDDSEYKDPKQEALPEGPSCLDTKGDVQQCLSDSDCCKGFYCGIDPAGSPRIRVCLYGGR
jgi:hypothetical protein